MRRLRKEFGGQERAAGEAAARRLRLLVEGWKAEDPTYDREAWPKLADALDRNRPEYRKQFPEGNVPRTS